jgi:hypothetical protein
VSQDGSSKSSVRVFPSSADEEVGLESCVFLSGCVSVSVLALGWALPELLSSSTLFFVLSAHSNVIWFLNRLSIRIPSSFV